VGKSSATAQLALSLSLAGHSVGILDIDLTGPSIPRLLGIESAKVKQAPGGWLPVEVHASQILQPTPSTTSTESVDTPNGVPNANGSSQNGLSTSTQPPATDDIPASAPQIGSLHAMSLAFLLASRSSAIVWRGPKKTAMVRQFLTDVLWPPTDYLLIDTPPGTSDEHISLVETLLKDVSLPNSVTNGIFNASRKPNLAGAVIVTTPQAVAVSDVRKELNFCAKTGVKVIGVVENMSGYVCECCGESTNVFSKGGGKVMAEEFGVPYLGGVPLDAQWGLLVEQGKRPKYEAIVKDGDAESEDAMAVNGHEKVQTEEEEQGQDKDEENDREEGLLVDKYRSCSLCPIFQAITATVVETVDSGRAVSVTRPV
jgi:Mrp family chromosome partitioning ATPase